MVPAVIQARPFNVVNRTSSKFEDFKARYFVHIAFVASALVTWPLLAEYEAFEMLYEFSRDHEDWDVDEISLLIVNLTVALIASSFVQSRRLRQLAKERSFEHERAEANARHDALTGLLNRRAFSAEMEKAARQKHDGKPRFIAMLDLDRFKPVNDLRGHAVGDATLQGVAQRLKDAIGKHDLLARLGGDEFTIVFGPDRTAVDVERCARRILFAIEQPFEIDGNQIMISCSMGLVQCCGALTCTDALSHADKALYAAKNHGRARFAWYDSALDDQAVARAEIEAALRVAIKTRAIKPWFQPIFDMKGQEISGFEVLARWTDPKLGVVPPSVFIEIAEDCGLIGRLGFCLLEQACQSACNWDPQLTIAFNLSPLQFHDPSLVKNIERTLTKCRFDPNRLTLEVTESSVITDFEAAAKKLSDLKELGISFALDDFGTGYSSLASLRQLPFDRLKIDRSFVTEICAHAQNQKIVSGIMALATGLELSVTAEGIETEEDLAFMQDLGCPFGQGYLFDQAVSAADVTRKLQTTWKDLAPSTKAARANAAANLR